ncbi:MAG TPA: TonB-dependent receptor, partial [Bacteroidia bacterium]|nr:TonB-dependent receptor [Bacteroidia bacterium]
NSFHFNVQNKFMLLKNLFFVPEVEYKKQSPWSNDGGALNDELSPFHILSEKLTGRGTLEYAATQNINFNGGFEYYTDYGKTRMEEQVFYSNQSDRLSYSDYAIFGQAMVKSRIVNVAMGARYNNNSMYNSSFVPRIAITKVVDDFHAKILFSKAFRSPNIMNIDVNPSIKPENTTVWEMETGYRFSDKISGSMNFFRIETNDIIVFYYDESIDDDGYTNLEKMGTKGVETEWRYKTKNGFVGANYSFYSPLNKESIIPDYEVQTNHDALLGFAVHKINLFGNRKLNHGIILGGTLSFYGPRYAISGMNDEGAMQYSLHHAFALINISVAKENLFVKNFSARFGIYNVTDENELFLPAYSIMRSPTPGKGREFALKLSYTIPY